MMTVVETPVVFALGSEHLLGVLTAPSGAASETAVLVVVGGPQVRAGSHRQFVQLARHLAAAGHATLRFDARGMGDSSGAPAGFEHLHSDIEAAIGTLMQQRPDVRRVVLWGLCDGASAALLYLHRNRDPRVGGLVLLNPWVRSPQTLAQARMRHYYAKRLLQAGFWRKLLAGRVGPAAVRSWWQNFQAAREGVPNSARAPSAASVAPFAVRMAEAWHRFPGPILLVLASDDVTAQEFAVHADADPAWQGALNQARVTRVDMAGADHTFSRSDVAARLLATAQSWLQAVDDSAK